MKKLLLLLFLLICIPAMSQEKTDSTSYCEIIGFCKSIGSPEKVTTQLVFGNRQIDSRYIDSETNKFYSFGTMPDALNFMIKHGWDFVQAYAVTYGQTSAVYHFLLKKK